MSAYFVKGKGWRYEFVLKGERHTKAWFKTRTEARQAEAQKREEIKNPQRDQKTPTDMDFLTLLNRRLDFVQHYNSENHFRNTLYHAKRWVKKWNGLMCSDISCEMIERFVIKRSKVSPVVANREIEYLRALLITASKES